MIWKRDRDRCVHKRPHKNDLPKPITKGLRKHFKSLPIYEEFFVGLNFFFIPPLKFF